MKDRLKQARWALEMTAQNNGISVDEVRREIKRAIACAWTEGHDNELWKQIACEDRIPTPEELIAFLCAEIRREELN